MLPSDHFDIRALWLANFHTLYFSSTRRFQTLGHWICAFVRLAPKSQLRRTHFYFFGSFFLGQFVLHNLRLAYQSLVHPVFPNPRGNSPRIQIQGTSRATAPYTSGSFETMSQPLHVVIIGAGECATLYSSGLARMKLKSRSCQASVVSSLHRGWKR
jgi:hypothetical protein